VQSTASYAHRAIVAQQACSSKTACFHCDAIGAVYWNGYDHHSSYFRYWKKMVCRDCGSVCEIKTVNNIEKMTRNFERGIIDGGNFYDAFYAVRKGLPAGAKQYIAIQSKELGQNRAWPVHVAQVRDVEPVPRQKSFHRENDRCKVYSKILLEPGTDKLWFDIQYCEYDSKALADQALEKLAM
jgi:hypothetical protein